MSAEKMAPEIAEDKLGEGGCKAADEEHHSAAHTEQPADRQPVDCSADVATKATQKANIKSHQITSNAEHPANLQPADCSTAANTVKKATQDAFSMLTRMMEQSASREKREQEREQAREENERTRRAAEQAEWQASHQAQLMVLSDLQQKLGSMSSRFTDIEEHVP